MKVAVTGHTNGIGQGLYRYFETQGYEVHGYSRSNGYTLPDAEHRVLNEIDDCDIFVNNAYPVSSQIFFVKHLWPRWVDKNKKIIVIGSIAAHLQFELEIQEYQQQKKELDILCKSLRYSSMNSACSIISIHPGYTMTNLYNISPLIFPPIDQCLTVDQVVSVVDYALTSSLKIDDIVVRR